MNSHKVGAIIVGGSITGLSTLRALAPLRIPIAVISLNPDSIAHYSKWASEHCKLYEFHRRPESLLELLKRQSEKWGGRIILTNYDEATKLISKNRNFLEQWYRVGSPHWEIVRYVLHKDLTYETACELEIPVPRIYGYATQDTASREDIDFPVLVKPVESRPFVLAFGVKLFVANNRSELQEMIRKTEELEIKAQIMDFIPGADDMFYNYTVYIDRKGNPAAELAMRKLRKSPPFFGVCRAAEVAEVPELREPTLNFLRRIGWHGMASAEYKLDSRDGKFKLMEINGRCFLIQGLAIRAGVNYPLLAWKELALGNIVRVSSNGWNGVWVHLLDDIYYGAFFRKVDGLSLKQYLATYKRSNAYAVWSIKDPMPFIMQFYYGLRKAASAVVSQGERTVLRSRVQKIQS